MKTGIIVFALVVLTGITACNSSPDYDFNANLPPPQGGGGGGAKSEAVFDPATGKIPPTNNLLFQGSTDGTLNIPIDPADPAAPLKQTLNALDGFSTVAPVTTEFGAPIDPASLAVGQTVRIFEVTADPATGAVLSVVRELPATEITAAAAGQNQTTLAILPLKPLKEKTTYLVALTNGIKDSAGTAMQGSLVYHLTKQTSPFANPDLAALEPVRQLVNTYEAAAASQGVNAADIILSWAFTTQSISDALNAAAAQVTAGALAVADTGLTTGNILGTTGITKVFAGTLTVPYYLNAPSQANPAAPLSGSWVDAAGKPVTRSAPVKTGDQTIPVLMTVPAGTAPANGWPVVIFQHGITQNRTNLLPIADALANAGFAGIAIDLPLHGITDAANALRALCAAPCTERTFDVDFINNTTSAAGPDGVVDPSGVHFLNLASLLTARDNVRQGAVDLMVLRDSLATMAGIDVDENRVHFVGHSLGAMVGTVFLAFEEDVNAASLAMPGGGIARLLDGSANFGPVIQAGLAAKGIVKGTPEYDAFMVVAQTAVDSADPVNHGAVASGLHPIHMIEVVGGNSSLPDQTVPNSVPGAPLSGTEPLAAVMGLQSVSSGTSTTGGIVRFTAGDHGSILSPAASLAATIEMQSEVAGFMASNGAALTVTDTSVVLQ